MLLADRQIESLAKDQSTGLLIEPFESHQLQGASYDIRVGKRILISGEDREHDLSKEKAISLSPGDFAVTVSHERFEVPQDIVEQILYDNWRMIISEYRKTSELTAQELSLIHLFVKAVPLYIVRFFKLSNSEEECLGHIEWLEWELSQVEKTTLVLQATIKRVLDELDAK